MGGAGLVRTWKDISVMLPGESFVRF